MGGLDGWVGGLVVWMGGWVAGWEGGWARAVKRRSLNYIVSICSVLFVFISCNMCVFPS